MPEKHQIRIDSPPSDAVIGLLQEHYEDMFKHSPPESVHALDVASLNSNDVTFWSSWDGDNIVACAALKQLDVQSVELKSMKTASAYLRRGAAAELLEHLIAESKARGYSVIYLETGSADAFRPARKLYSSFSFEEVGPFADYNLDPHSVFMRLEIGEL